VDEVAAAQFVRREADDLGDAVEMALEREDALRRSESAEGAVRRHIGGDGAAANAHVGAVVRTGGVNRAARENDRRKSFVGAAVNGEVDFDREELAIAREGGLVVGA